MTYHIEKVEVDGVEGMSSDMIIQRHIVSANQLCDKVDKLKDQIDKGELDGKSGLGSLLNSVISDNVSS
mgnify:CR=1 FL=1